MIEIRKGRYAERDKIKFLVDSAEEMDTIDETFSSAYFARLIREGIVLVATHLRRVIGVCFGSYNREEGWADLLGIVVSPQYRRKAIARRLVQSFEQSARKKNALTIDLFAHPSKVGFFDALGYRGGNKYVALRKVLT